MAKAKELDCNKCENNESRCVCNPFKGCMVACPNYKEKKGESDGN